jgi:hypothetical protein
MAWGAFASVCLAPFLFGAVERDVWIPLCQCWLGLGLLSTLAGSRNRPGATPAAAAFTSRALLPIHALFCAQLIPLPGALLRLLSPGSFAAHFLPDPGKGSLRPLSVSPSATVEAWLYVAGLQGLFLALQGLSQEDRRACRIALLGVILLLAGEGLWQSRSAHPFWLNGLVPVIVPSGFETAVFGPYFNRNHFATVIAMGCGLSAGLAATAVHERGGVKRLLVHPLTLSAVVFLAGSSVALVITSAASGSRSGVLAALLAIAVVVARGRGMPFLLAALGVGLVGLVVTGGFAIERLALLDVLQSRLAPWMDMARVIRFFPAFGSGFGTFAVTYWPYQENVRYEFWQHAHNEYLQFVIEAGIAGVLVLYLIARRFRQGVVLAPEAREAALGVATAFWTQAVFDFPCRVPANAAVFVCLIALFVSAEPAKRGAPA